MSNNKEREMLRKALSLASMNTDTKTPYITHYDHEEPEVVTISITNDGITLFSKEDGKINIEEGDPIEVNSEKYNRPHSIASNENEKVLNIGIANPDLHTHLNKFKESFKGGLFNIVIDGLIPSTDPVSNEEVTIIRYHLVPKGE